jgi:hypothetical protein
LLQLLQPLWLFTLTGISIPVVIHLWNQQPGKILKVGSISLVTASVKEYKKSLTLSDILLLILRCLLIAALAFALTKPTWRFTSGPAKQKDWVVISKENTQETYWHFKPFIDSLLKAGGEFHSFNKGFQKEDLMEIFKNKRDTMAAKPPSYWSLATALDETISHSIPIYLFTDNYLVHFTGTRPIVSPNLKWFTYTPKDTAIQQSFTDKKDSASLRITLFTGKNTGEARYLKAAIDAIQQFSKRSIQLSVTGNVAEMQRTQDWLFWLSDEPLTKEENNAKNIFTYEKGKVKSNLSWIRATNDISFAPVELYKSIVPANSLNDSYATIWQDGYGHPVLSTEKRNERSYYHFYSRFDPAWNELVWGSSFPGLIYSLLEKEEAKKTPINSSDKRVIDSKQLLPNFLKENEVKNQAASFKTIDLTDLFWLLVFLLFIVERLVSFQYYKQKTND